LGLPGALFLHILAGSGYLQRGLEAFTAEDEDEDEDEDAEVAEAISQE
jgi:hypothetical protein